MSSRVDVLSDGYAYMLESSHKKSEQDKLMKANGSSCLVRSRGLNILFDTMGPWDQDKLLTSLSAKSIHPDNINYVICSHSHPDHVGNLNLFTRAEKHFVGTSVYTKDLYDLSCFEPTGSYSYKTKRGIDVEVPQYKIYKLNSDSSILPTQGHTMECVSLVVSNCDIYGTVGLVGDLFEREEDVEDESIWLGAGSQNPDLQRANRAQIFNTVDYIIPGHGPMFKVLKRDFQVKF